MIKRNLKFSLFILGILFFLNILAWLAVFDLAKPQFLEVTFFDIGQGDAIFIETPKKHQILIDGGPSAVILEKLGKEMPFWDKSIDLIILTHPERDHLAGLIEVLKKYQVENILWTGIIRDTAEYQEWLKLIKEDSNPSTTFPLRRAPKANIFIAKNGQKIKAAKTVLDILYPFENLADQEFKNSNDTSIVSRLVFNNTSFLFTGDITQMVEKELSNSHELENIDSNVLKVAHHGSKTSSSEEFLKEVSPEIAVISAGKENSYGHPHSEVLERLENFGIKVLRTDQVGDIKIFSDGENLKYQFSNPNFQSSSN